MPPRGRLPRRLVRRSLARRRKPCERRLGVRRLSAMSQFHIRLATRADLYLISHHRARMFFDMGELSSEMFESFRAQSRTVLQRMLTDGKYIGWLASPHDEPFQIVAGAGVTLREVAPHPQPNANGKFEIVSGRQAIIQ